MNNIFSFLSLKKNCKKDFSAFPPYRLVVLGDCATQHLSDAIKGYAYEERIGLTIFDADYNQIDAQIMDKDSELYHYMPDSVLIFMCVEKLYERFCNTDIAARYTFADDVFAGISCYWSIINSNIKNNIIQFTFSESDDRIFGNYSLKTQASFHYQIKKLNYLLMNGCQAFKNVFLIDINDIQSRLGQSCFHDDKLYYVAKMPISTAALPLVAKEVIDTVKSLCGRIKKCVVLDLDNTLWGGVIGDDGMDGIQIGELGIGHAFSDFQMWLRELRKRGIILCVCSKNNEDTAKEPFEKHPEMVLRLDDISVFVANWDDKASNIRFIQETLNIGMDSMVFIDDNPFERNLVAQLIPDITVPELTDDPAEYLGYLKSLNLFETASYSDADGDRTKQYQAEAGRTLLQKSFESYDDYLKELEMTAIVRPFDEYYYPRIAQLTQRSNQFNLRTVRYTEAEIEALANNDNRLTLYFTLKDKYGDHGLVSVVIMDKQENATLFISEWLMSCRVLKRGMEEFIVNQIIATAKANGFIKIVGEYIKTPKNSMVEKIYSRLGFTDNGDNTFAVLADDYIYHKTHIIKEECY